MKIESPAFEHHAFIPKRYTCEGSNVSPPLDFFDIPAKAKSLILIVEDPDAPGGTFDHWIAWNIAPTTVHLQEKAAVDYQGTNGFGQNNYKGPCPPHGKPHRYFFKLYALDVILDLPEGSTKALLENAIEGHILSKAELIGLYQR
jgi:Raf kinase inhibitor-like YbhB/YbcL family protein